MVRHNLKISQQMLQEFLSMSDNFGTLCIKRLNKLELEKNERRRIWKQQLFLKVVAPCI